MSNDNKEINNEVNKKNEEKVIQKTPKFYKKFWYSITKFEKYPEMAAQGVPSALGYLCKIMAIFSIVITISITIQLGQIITNSINYIKTELPNFYYKEGNLVFESDNEIIIDKSNEIFGKIIIDTNTTNQGQINKYINSIPNEEKGLILLKENIILKNLLTTGEVTYNYKEAFEQNNITEFTKQDIINFTKGQEMPSLYLSFALIIFIYSFIMYITSTIMDSIILAILGYITAIIAKIKMKFVAIYNMSVYALTLSILLNLLYIIINMFIGFKITYFQVMYTSVAYIYLVAAIFIIKSEFIKKQAELMKILQEQQKQSKINLENTEDEKKENKDVGKEDKKEEKEENEENNNDTGEEPEGSKA